MRIDFDISAPIRSLDAKINYLVLRIKSSIIFSGKYIMFMEIAITIILILFSLWYGRHPTLTEFRELAGAYGPVLGMQRKRFQMTNRPKSVIASTIFTLLNALLWLVLGIIIAVGAHPALRVASEIKWILAGLSIIMGVIILVLFFFLNRRNRSAYFFTLALFIFTAILTIFDDVGLSDLVVLALNIIPVVLLIKDRAWYLKTKPQIDGSV
jgi:lysylphosphatidylglycerol synthetase-like protein (DUF2156 family)